MYKSVCVVVVLLAAFAFTSGSRSADASPTTPIGPAIVAHAKLLNQTTPIPTTTIFTPTQSGLYRLTVYGTITTSTCSGSVWTFTPEWTDDSGVLGNASGIVQSNGNCLGSFFSFDSGFLTGATITFEAKGGTAITYDVFGSSDGSAYSLYYTLERLE